MESVRPKAPENAYMMAFVSLCMCSQAHAYAHNQHNKKVDTIVNSGTQDSHEINPIDNDKHLHELIYKILCIGYLEIYTYIKYMYVCIYTQRDHHEVS